MRLFPPGVKKRSTLVVVVLVPNKKKKKDCKKQCEVAKAADPTNIGRKYKERKRLIHTHTHAQLTGSSVR